MYLQEKLRAMAAEDRRVASLVTDKPRGCVVDDCQWIDAVAIPAGTGGRGVVYPEIVEQVARHSPAETLRRAEIWEAVAELYDSALANHDGCNKTGCRVCGALAALAARVGEP